MISIYDGRPVRAQVAVKVIRANEVMFKAGQTETVILRKLSGADPEGKRHVVRLLRTFEYRQHLCLVFENMVSSHLPLMQVLWAAIDGFSYVWVPVKMQGDHPSPRFHHGSGCLQPPANQPTSEHQLDMLTGLRTCLP